MVPEPVAVNVRNREHRIRATVDVPERGPGDAPVEGVILAQGSGLGGWSLYVTEGRLAYAHNFVALEEHLVESPEPLTPGRHQVEFHFERTGRAPGGRPPAGRRRRDRPGRHPAVHPHPVLVDRGRTHLRLQRRAPGDPPVRRPVPLHRGIEEVVVEVDGPPWEDPEAEAEHAMAVQ